jgi:N-acyl-D-aspartate/D-glutamate deacylase
MPDAHLETLRRLAPYIARGAAPQISSVPRTHHVSLRSPLPYRSFRVWAPIFDRTKEEQSAYFRDPAFRNAFREELKEPEKVRRAAWHSVRVNEVGSAHLRHLEGRTIADIARERGTDGLDTLLDLGLEDNLDIEFVFENLNADIERVAGLLNDPSLLIGLGDAGAHVSQMCAAGYTTYLLGTWVRERKAMTLEAAVQRLTSHPAAFFGFKDRGRLAPGLAADIVVFDPSTIGSAAKTAKLYDLPGGAMRIVTQATGVDYTIVNGQVAHANGAMTGSMSGQVLRP